MSASKSYAPPAFARGDEVNGFEVVQATPIASMNFQVFEFLHKKSGARLLHIAADDPENLFSVAFRTPPEDDTGLPHILEHSVLCGSRRFPVKDPFVELLKTSLATFLNAFTYPDRTCYPCSSMNPKDFHNLMRVYCDAVFFPILSEDHFRQEGHHFEFLPDGRLTVKGVVYNEMRGVYSDPDSILDRHIQRILFESNAYGRDFGGDPKAIPQLTYTQYLNFHRTYYHPSNAWIFTYGNVDIAGTLAILDAEYLGKFNAITLDSTIKPLTRWTAPREGIFPYPLGAEDSTQSRTDVAVAFAANDRRDVLENLAMKVVDMYFLDNASSPLRKALIDSKLGEELGSSGHADYQRDTFFQVVLKGSEAERAQEVEALILETVSGECEKGFDRDRVESALHQLELSSREIRPQYPLRLLDRVFAAWLYDTNPLRQIDIAESLDALRRTIHGQERFLEELTRKHLVDNPHRLRVALVPDREFVERNDRETAETLAAALAEMTDGRKREVAETASRLEAMQSEGNSPEALATLPRLAKSDVSPEPLPLEYRVEKVAERDFLVVPAYSGGIGYLNVNLRLSGLTTEEITLLPLFCEALGKTGAAGLDYAQMAEREAASVGALEFSAGVTPHVEGPHRAALRMTVWLKALESDWEKALGIMGNRLFRADWSDRERLKDIVLQSRMAWRNQIVPAGNAYAAMYAARGLTPALTLSEQLSGCTQARFVDRLAGEIDGRLSGLVERLAALGEKVLAGSSLACSTIGSDDAVGLSRAWMRGESGRFGGRGETQELPRPVPGATRIGLAAPADVAYTARVIPAPAFTDPDAAALVLLGMQLSYGHLWNEVRVKGGAYGVRAQYDGMRGSFNFSSFRDPNILRTLDAFSSCPGFIAKEMDLSEKGLEQAIIGAIKAFDVPMRPPTAVATALVRHLGGETDEFRGRFRKRLLNLTADDVLGAAARVFAGLENGPVCVVSSRERLEAENGAADGEGALEIEPLWPA